MGSGAEEYHCGESFEALLVMGPGGWKGELGENGAKHTLGGLLRFLNRRATGATTSRSLFGVGSKELYDRVK